ncbi:YbaK/EbsC family protein [Actinomadura sp. 9N215]|uniref:YbaK/EbsC family protein n=1 Tax=Actinomadura sp. 9N215 TaxID=3375150 RepID=UPI0037957EFA
MKDALTIHRALLEREAVHEIVRLPVALAHADELPKALGLPADRCLVTCVYSCNYNDSNSDGYDYDYGSSGFPGRQFLTGVIVPAGERPPLDAVRRAVGAETVRPAHADVVNAVTEYAAGLVCPLLLPDDMPLLIDRRIIDRPVVDGLPTDSLPADGLPTDDVPADDVVYTATGEASTALGIRGRTLYALCHAQPADLFRAPSAAARPAKQGPRHPVA